MTRIEQTFQRLRQDGQKAFIGFITAGDPDLAVTEELVPALERAGVDIIELGVPFSDPLADGPTIQASYERALGAKTSLAGILAMVRRLRKRTGIPLVLMSAYNPVFHFGEETFVAKATSAGVDGVILPDLPPEEAGNFLSLSRKTGLDVIFLVAPTTRPDRQRYIISKASGFVYYVSLTGVTGARKSLPESYQRQVRELKALSDLPVCVGFGISTPDQVRRVVRVADGVIVGSALVDQIARYGQRPDLVQRIERFTRLLTKEAHAHV